MLNSSVSNLSAVNGDACWALALGWRHHRSVPGTKHPVKLQPAEQMDTGAPMRPCVSECGVCACCSLPMRCHGSDSGAKMCAKHIRALVHCIGTCWQMRGSYACNLFAFRLGGLQACLPPLTGKQSEFSELMDTALFLPSPLKLLVAPNDFALWFGEQYGSKGFAEHKHLWRRFKNALPMDTVTAICTEGMPSAGRHSKLACKQQRAAADMS